MEAIPHSGARPACADRNRHARFDRQPLATPCPGLNDSNEFVYAFASTSGYTALRKQGANGLEELARSDSGPLLYVPDPISTHSLANDGRTIMGAPDGMLYVMPDGAAAFTADPTLSSILAGTMSDDHFVVFRAVRESPDGPVAGIYRGSSTPSVEEGPAEVGVILPVAPATSNSGVIAFVGESSAGMRRILSTTDGLSFLDHTGALASVATPDFSLGSGRLVVFTAAVGDGMGAFVGPDAVNNKVLVPGDALDGSIVVTVKLWLEGMNAAGHISLWVQLADGRSAIYRVDPILAPIAEDGTLDAVINLPVSGTLVATDPANQPLTYEIRTNGAKGIAVITDPATGAFTYTPLPNAAGSDSFTFDATNGVLRSNVATIVISIAATGNRPPMAISGGSGPTQSVRFDSVADELSRTTNLPPITGFTMMGWFRVVSDGSTYSTFLRLGHATTSDGYNILRCCAPTSSSLLLWTGAGIRNAGPLTVGEWHHLALSVEGQGPGQAKLYKNGALVLTFDGNPNVPAQRLSIGNDAHLEWLNGNAATVKGMRGVDTSGNRHGNVALRAAVGTISIAGIRCKPPKVPPPISAATIARSQPPAQSRQTHQVRPCWPQSVPRTSPAAGRCRQSTPTTIRSRMRLFPTEPRVQRRSRVPGAPATPIRRISELLEPMFSLSGQTMASSIRMLPRCRS